MENLKNNKEFTTWCRSLYDENCLERHRHGQKPYETFEVYFNTHTKWLWEQYQNRSNAKSIYLT